MEFVEVMRQWNRMCRTFDKGERCTECPIPNVHMCWYIGDDWIKDKYYDEVENIVMSWAAEHPEPVYPTWGEWFEEHGDLIRGWHNATNVQWMAHTFSRLLCTPIHADIAQKLGLQPKEGA